MDVNSLDFVKNLVAISPGAKEAVQEMAEDWGAEDPPITTLFGIIGSRIARNLSQDFCSESSEIFDMIERAFDDPDSLLSVAVATGLVEAMANRLSQQRLIWQKVLAMLGPQTRRHAEAWLAPEWGKSG